MHLQHIYLKNTKTYTWKDIFTPTFTAALFPVPKHGDKPKCPIEDWIKNMWYIYTMG